MTSIKLLKNSFGFNVFFSVFPSTRAFWCMPWMKRFIPSAKEKPVYVLVSIVKFGKVQAVEGVFATNFVAVVQYRVKEDIEETGFS